MTTERYHRAACHLCPQTCEWQQGWKTSCCLQTVSYVCKVHRLCPSLGRKGSQRSINVPQCQEGLFPFSAVGGSQRCQGGMGCSPHSIYLTGKRACQQVTILTSTLSPYPGATFLFPFGWLGLFERQNKLTYV